MKILVSGSSGHLGEALMRTFRAEGIEAIGIDILPSSFTDRIGSIAQRDFVAQCMHGVDAVLHTATLHKPHVATHTRQHFIDTNITGTLNLLEEACAANVQRFVFTSTTSVFGDAMQPTPGAPAVWVTEQLTPIPKNIYGVTKLAAENLCELFARKFGLSCLVLRTSRFFPEADDDPDRRNTRSDANLKVNEYLHRRADIEDIVSAHRAALDRAPTLGFGRYIITATTPFNRDDLTELAMNAPAVVKRYAPEYVEEYARRNWTMFAGIDRVYVNDLARSELRWQPKYDFAALVARMHGTDDVRSPLARMIGAKGYHTETFADGPYPVE
jgi:UDP-glucose 4-epimerase